jgi:hypothetical protein
MIHTAVAHFPDFAVSNAAGSERRIQTMKTAVRMLLLGLATLTMTGAAQEQGSARLVRDGTHARLTASGPRPLDLAARKLAEEFGVAISVEDPAYLFRGDLARVGTTRTGDPLLVPKPSSFEVALDMTPDVAILDSRQLVEMMAAKANERWPRRIFEHAQLLVDSLQQQTGLRISCCQSFLSGIPWGNAVVSFEARDEPARTVLLQLLRLEPGRGRMVRDGAGGAFQLVPSNPARERWTY